MQKREFLKGLSLIIGSTAATHLTGVAQAIPVALAYEPRSDSAESDGQFFSQAEMQLLKDVCQGVIPATETPGAGELDVHGFIDNQLVHCHAENDRHKARSALEALQREATRAHDMDFISCSLEQQLALLQAIEVGETPFHEGNQWDFRFLKHLVVFGY